MILPSSDLEHVKWVLNNISQTRTVDGICDLIDRLISTNQSTFKCDGIEDKNYYTDPSVDSKEDKKQIELGEVLIPKTETVFTCPHCGETFKV